jgi:hypothetical protein
MRAFAASSIIVTIPRRVKRHVISRFSDYAPFSVRFFRSVNDESERSAVLVVGKGNHFNVTKLSFPELKQKCALYLFRHVVVEQSVAWWLPCGANT